MPPAPPLVPARFLVALAGAGAGCGLLYVALVLTSDHVQDRALIAALGLVVGWSFVGTGLFAWWRRPGNRTGLLMTAAGFAWFSSGLSASNDDVVHTVGIALDGVFPAVVGHLLLAFPSGRLEGRAERAVVTAAYLVVTVLQVPALLFEDDARNLLTITVDQGLSDALDAVQYVAAVGLVAAAAVLLVRRWGAVPRAQRRAVEPVLLTGGAAFAAYLLAKGFDAAGARKSGLEALALALVATLPFGFLAGLLRSRLAQAAAVADLVRRLGEAPEPGALRAALAEALGDPALALAYWVPQSERFVDAEGHPLELRDGTWSEVELNGRRVGAIVHGAAPAEEHELVTAAAAAAALAVENQRLSAELRARIDELRASRARLVAVGDAERRRLERDLHDGAQSRLVALAVKLRLARMRAEGESEVAALLDESSAELQASLDELRELARGIHPAVLTDRGLGPALVSLANRSPVPVDIVGAPPADLEASIATAVYFVAAEALTNVAKYSRAEHASIRIERRGDTVVLEVADDGIGGADIDAGSGLRGLGERLAALDGRLEVRSPAHGGTSVRAEIPLSSG